MDANLLTNLMNPPILFFFFGVFVRLIGSNLEIPPALTKFFSLYMLMAIGIKGGTALAETGLSQEAVIVLGAAIIMSILVPIYSYPILRIRLKNLYDAAAIASCYGSVSAVTFIAASSFMVKMGVDHGGYMVVALVLMESPAIVMAVLLATMIRSKEAQGTGVQAQNKPRTFPMKKILHEAFTDGTHLMLIGSLVIGAITGIEGKKAMEPFTGGIFKGMLSFFLLDMGLSVASRLREMKDVGVFLVGFGVVMPVLNSALALGIAHFLGFGMGDAFLFIILVASASYIAVPAVVRYAIPEANPSLYFTMALAVTFPFNIIIGIPLYYKMVTVVWGG
ncbi:sodium-dependent bicarbonate transport family permease [Nitrospira defluvii]|nr:sodium-dependent bicarbonate transport family permease [Nitrospira defluvii]